MVIASSTDVHEAHQAKSQPSRPTSSPLLITIQKRANSPFGMQFLGVPQPQPKAIYTGRMLCKASTKEPEETGTDSKDGSTKTDWADDEDNWKD